MKLVDLSFGRFQNKPWIYAGKDGNPLVQQIGVVLGLVGVSSSLCKYCVQIIKQPCQAD